MNICELFPFIPNKHRIKTVLGSLHEKLRGLDFTMPDRMYDRNRRDGAMYYASPEGILREIFSLVDRETYSRFLDVGCGKGYVLWQAKLFGFNRVGGVEYDEKLCDVCSRNLRKLGLSGEVELHCADACDFSGYGNYDVFYFFNPFTDRIMRRVMGQIRNQCRGREILLIYYHPRYPGAIEESGCFQLRQILYDPEKNYEVYVYSGKIPE